MVSIDYPRALLVGLAVLTALALVVAGSTSTAAFGVYNQRWDGAADLRELASERGTEPVIVRNTSRYDGIPGEDSLAILLSPDSPYSAGELDRLEAFVRRGGTLVVAEDYGAEGNRILAGIGAEARVDGAPLRDERHQFRSPAMPEATNVSGTGVTAGIESITLNHGTAVEPNGATVLIRSSEFAYLDHNGNDALDEAESIGRYPVLTMETLGSGTVYVLGDPSALINVMLDRPGNRALARALVADQSRVLLDYSHVQGFPPLALAILVLRESAVLQVVLGLGVIGLIAVWGRPPVSLARIHGEATDSEPGTMDADSMVRYLERRHPEWEPDRVRRIVKGLITQRTDIEDDG